MKLLFGNIDYRRHMTDEGEQLQRGLEAAGWKLVGPEFGDGCRDVPELLERHRPEAAIVHDKRDWSPDSEGAFRKDIGFERLNALRDWPCFRAAVLKDAASVQAYQEEFFNEVGADAAIVYYDPATVRALNPWLKAACIRTYHSVDGHLCAEIDLTRPRRPAVMSGALNGAVYPLRQAVFEWRRYNDRDFLDVLTHPGYHNAGAHTPAYLAQLASYRVHFASASRYGFALRKIIESVAMGATPVTDLPERDRLPEIDEALVRVAPDSHPAHVLRVIKQANADWNLKERLMWAKRARQWYDFRAIGKRLSADLKFVKNLLSRAA